MTRTSKVAYALLLVAAVLLASAWQLQREAAGELARALEVQQARVPETASAPPNLAQYRDVVKSLDQSISIRARTEASLSRVDAILRALQGRERDAKAIARQVRDQLRAIAGTLGGAAVSARRSVDGLGALGARLRVSDQLARLIVKELARLDRKLGPSLGRVP